MIHSFIIHLIHSFFVRISEIFKEHKLSLDVCGLTLVIPIEIITLTDSLYEVTAQMCVVQCTIRFLKVANLSVLFVIHIYVQVL